jgi:hypothetical protein
VVVVVVVIHQVVQLGCLAVVAAEPAEMAHHQLMVACQLRQVKEIKVEIINHLDILGNTLVAVAVAVQVVRVEWVALLQDNQLVLEE